MCFGVEGFIHGYLINEKGIRFRENLKTRMPGLRSWCDSGRKLYQVSDPWMFWRNIHTNPEKYGFDCLRIVSLVVVVEGVYGLLSRGYDLATALSSLTDIVIDGEEMYLPIGEKRIYPLCVKGSFIEQEGAGKAVCLADLVLDGTMVAGKASGWELTKFLMGAEVAAGDVFFAGINGFNNHPKFGNDDAQNGFILESPKGELIDAKSVLVFGHQKDVEGRILSLFEVMSALYKTASKYGMSGDTFHEKGSPFLIVIRRDKDVWIDFLEEKLRASPR